MEPLPTFYHFVYPSWFYRLGGFANSENIPMFVDFYKISFKEFHSKARLWATINKPNVSCRLSFSSTCLLLYPRPSLLSLLSLLYPPFSYPCIHLITLVQHNCNKVWLQVQSTSPSAHANSYIDL